MIYRAMCLASIVLVSGCSSSSDDTAPDTDDITVGSEADESNLITDADDDIPVDTDTDTNETNVSLDVSDSVGGSETNLLSGIQLDSTPERIGLIVLSESERFSDVSAFGFFANWPAANGTDASLLFGPELVLEGDTCVVTANTIENDSTLTDYLQDNFESISAGEIITLSSAASTYGSLERLEVREPDLLYLSLTELAFPSPDVLTISIPGDEYPANTFVAPRSQPIEGFSIAVGTEIEASQTVTWNASIQEDTFISLSFSDAGQTFEYTAECLLIDDGEFVIPESLQADASAITGDAAVMNLESVSRLIAGMSDDGLPTDALIYIRSVASEGL